MITDQSVQGIKLVHTMNTSPQRNFKHPWA
uniref:Uncharacterized protein n=1 Tax=Arundo donax TaxID=35708 RepID=A0A0A8ZR55_ARUDO